MQYLALTWERETEFQALGRNGYFRAMGIEIHNLGSCLSIENITSRGVVGTGRVTVQADPDALRSIATWLTCKADELDRERCDRSYVAAFEEVPGS